MQKPIKGTAIEYYRIEAPTRALLKQGLATAFVEDHTHLESKEDLEFCLPVMAKADFHIYLNRPSQGLMDRVAELTRLKPGRTAPYGEIQHPPKIFWSIDDNYHWVHPLNPSFLYNGYRLPDGRELGKEDLDMDLGNGKRERVWTYGKRYGPKVFDPIQNRRDVRRMDQFIATHAAGVMFTTDRLRKFYEDEIGFEHTYVYPNCLLFDDLANLYKHGKYVRNDPKQVRVLWQGGASHFMDLVPIRNSMIKLAKSMPELVWMIWGTQFNWISRNVPDRNVEILPWVDYAAYKPMLSVIDFDFALAPLVDNPFNQAKSAIKVYEAAALPVPKPTLAAKVPPYSDEFVDGETAMLWDPKDPQEFEEKFRELAGNPELRDRIAKNCHEWVREHRDAMKEAPKLLEWMVSLRGKQRSVPKQLQDLTARAADLMEPHPQDAFAE